MVEWKIQVQSSQGDWAQVPPLRTIALSYWLTCQQLKDRGVISMPAHGASGNWSALVERLVFSFRLYLRGWRVGPVVRKNLLFLYRTKIQFPALTLSGSPLPITPVTGGSDASGLWRHCTHMSVFIQRHTNIIKKSNRSRIGKEVEFSATCWLAMTPESFKIK